MNPHLTRTIFTRHLACLQTVNLTMSCLITRSLENTNRSSCYSHSTACLSDTTDLNPFLATHSPSWIHLESATAEEIVEKLRIYWDADDLTVGHCTSTPASSVIFDYLCSEEGQQIPLRLISFKNGIDDLSLEALASYLTSRRTWFGLTHLDILVRRFCRP